MIVPQEPEPFDSAFWAELEEIQCPCQGSGWADINCKWVECAIHHEGQLHPDSMQLLMDDLAALAEAERASKLLWKIGIAKEELGRRQAAVKESQKEVLRLELELINKTPTTKIAVVVPPDCYPAT